MDTSALSMNGVEEVVPEGALDALLRRARMEIRPHNADWLAPMRFG